MRLVISLVAFLLSSSAWSNIDSNDVVSECDDTQSAGEAFCVGYYSATITATTGTAGMLSEDKLLCLPDNFSTGIGIKIWQRYLEENPEKLTTRLL